MRSQGCAARSSNPCIAMHYFDVPLIFFNNVEHTPLRLWGGCVYAWAQMHVHSWTSQKLQHDYKNSMKVGGLKVLLMNERHTLQLLKTSDGSSLRYRAKPKRTAVLVAWTSVSCWVLWHGELCKVLQLHEQHSWSKWCPRQHLHISLALLNTTVFLDRCGNNRHSHLDILYQLTAHH